eukprot:tig00021493_g21887.t1
MAQPPLRQPVRQDSRASVQLYASGHMPPPYDTASNASGGGVGANIEEADRYGRTALLKAVEQGNLSLARRLLENGADVEARLMNGFTPLLVACVMERPDLVRTVLEFGADVRAAASDGRTAITFAGHVPEIRNLLLVRAARDGHGDELRALLKLGANINARDHEHFTPLIAAAAGGHWEIIRELFSWEQEMQKSHTIQKSGLAVEDDDDYLYGDDFDDARSARSGQNRRSTTWSRSGRPSGVDGGGGGGRRHKIDLEAKDMQGRTAIMHAAGGGFLEICKDLVQRGADPLAVDSAGTSPILKAAGAHHLPVARYLIDVCDGEIEVCGAANGETLRALASCLADLPFEKCSRHRVRALLVFANTFKDMEVEDKFHASTLKELREKCIARATELMNVYTAEYGKRLVGHQIDGVSVLDLALDCEAHSFIGHAAVQEYVQDIWMGRRIVARVDGGTAWERLRDHFRLAPRSKFWLEMATYFMYLIIFSLVMWMRRYSFNWLETFMYLYVVAMALNEARQMRRAGASEYFSDMWNMLDVCIIGMTSAAMVLRVVALSLDDDGRRWWTEKTFNVLSCSAVLLWIRLLNIFSFHPRLGEMLEIIRGMFTDFITFSAILLLVIIGFTQALHGLWGGVVLHEGQAGTAAPGNAKEGDGEAPSMLDAMIFLFRAMVGDFSFHDSGVGAPFLGRLVFGFFLIITNILLLNLLIASFSNTFTIVSTVSRNTLLFKLTERVLEYEKALFRLPPPLNLLDPFIALLRCCLVRSGKAEHARAMEGLEDGFDGGFEPGGYAAGEGHGGLLRDPDESWIYAPFKRGGGKRRTSEGGLARAGSTGPAGLAAGKEPKGDGGGGGNVQAILPDLQNLFDKKLMEMRNGMEVAFQMKIQALETRLGEVLSKLDAKVDVVDDKLDEVGKKIRGGLRF